MCALTAERMSREKAPSSHTVKCRDGCGQRSRVARTGVVSSEAVTRGSSGSPLDDLPKRVSAPWRNANGVRGSEVAAYRQQHMCPGYGTPALASRHQSPRSRTNRVGIVAFVALVFAMPSVAMAAIPEPGAIFWGALTPEAPGVQRTIEARLGQQLIASYTIGTIPSAGSLYVLRLQVESPEAIDEPRSAGTIRVNDTVQFFVNNKEIGRAEIVERAQVNKRDFTIVGCGNGVIEVGEQCDDGNVNNGDCCSATCNHEPNGSTCDDDLFCNGVGTCSNGNCDQDGDPCVGQPACLSNCNEIANNCLAAADTPCEDDDNGCTDDLCDGAGACTHLPNTDGCDDGKWCNGQDTCNDGKCAKHQGDPCVPPCAVRCLEDQDECLIDAGATCDDENECTRNDKCSDRGFCVGENEPDEQGCDVGGALEMCCVGACVEGDECSLTECSVAFYVVPAAAIEISEIIWIGSYADVGGRFVDVGGGVDCSPLSDGDGEFLHDAATKAVFAAVSYPDGVSEDEIYVESGIVRLATCAFQFPGAPSSTNFKTLTTSATGVDGSPLGTRPRILVRLGTDCLLCGRPVTRGDRPTASDALFVLKAAVQQETCGPCVCDVDDSGTITATDALKTLTSAVGAATSLTCGACAAAPVTREVASEDDATTTTTTTVTSTTTQSR